MIQNIKMPSAGQTTDELFIVKWLKQEGDSVDRGDVLLEIETDKANVEVESFAKGTLLKILFNEGATATAGEVIAYIGNADDTIPEVASATTTTVNEDDEYQPIMPGIVSNEAEGAPAVTESGFEYQASPAAKKAARDHGLDLNAIFQATQNPKIKYADVVAYAESDRQSLPADEATALFEMHPISTMRRVIAKKMMQSVSSMPTFTAEIEIDMEPTIRLRKELNSKEEGIRIAFHDILAKCFAAVAQKHEYVNASYEEEAIRVHKTVNMGLAISLDNGLIVPVVRNIEKKGLQTIAAENAENINKAREGKIGTENLVGGTCTISNLGMFPINRFTAIINPPESCILALGTITKRPVWIEDGVVGKPMMTITATFDHRLIDGAYGAAFLNDLKLYMESPYKLLL